MTVMFIRWLRGTSKSMLFQEITCTFVKSNYEISSQPTIKEGVAPTTHQSGGPAKSISCHSEVTSWDAWHFNPNY